jgi:hypothetical protein
MGTGSIGLKSLIRFETTPDASSVIIVYGNFLGPSAGAAAMALNLPA